MAGKKEARAKFTADTTEFNKSIKEAESQLKLLKKELRNNKTEMDGAGDSVDLLTQRSTILWKEIEANRTKQEALNSKLQKAIELYGEDSNEVNSLRMQILDAANAEEKMMQDIEATSKKLEEQMKASEDTRTSLEKLTDEIKVQESNLQSLKDEYVSVVLEQGESSDKAQSLATRIGYLSEELEDNKKKLNDAKEAAESFCRIIDDVEEETEDTRNSFEKLADEVKEQESRLQALKAKYSNLVLEQGETAEETQHLATEILDLTQELEKNKSKMEQAERAADDLEESFEDAGDEAKDAEDGFTIMKGTLADLVSNAIQGAISKIGELISSIIGLADETREFRTEMGKLDAAFEDNGYTAEEAKDIYNELYGVLADSTTASTAASNLSAIGLEQKELSELTQAMIGIWSAYGDSIPLDGLAESINETSKVSKVTGNLADALNWAGISEDDFNTKLENCSSKQERQQLIVDTLSQKYSGLADSYRENNESIIEANEANANYETALANVGEAIEPVTTAFMNWKTEIITGAVPAIQTVSGWVQNLTTWMSENEEEAMIIKGVIIGVAAALGILATALLITNLINAVKNAFIALNLVMSLNPITLVIAALAGLVAAIIYLRNTSESFRKFWSGVWSKITGTVSGAISSVNSFFRNIKLPHISISWDTSGWKAKAAQLLGFDGWPNIGVSWYAKGGYFTGPTVLSGLGEAGDEYALPLNKTTLAPLAEMLVMGMQSVANSNGDTGVIDRLEAIERAVLKNKDTYLDSVKVSKGLAPSSDKVSGLRTSLIDRGLSYV